MIVSVGAGAGVLYVDGRWVLLTACVEETIDDLAGGEKILCLQPHFSGLKSKYIVEFMLFSLKKKWAKTLI